jgi:hypothetical protein
MKRFSVELYFFKAHFLGSALEEVPNLEKYQPETKMGEFSANSWDAAKKIILAQYPDVAYIHVIDSASLDY